jgi:hypothetical protein
MGTRNLTCVFLDGDFKVAQYGQWGGYPDGQGETIRKFLAEANIPLFRDQVRKVGRIDEETIEERWIEAGAEPDALGVPFEVSDRFKEMYPELHRDTGAEILGIIMNMEGDCLLLKDRRTFGTDSLFCEWAYVIDLDNNTLEVYKGFNKDHSADFGRFANIKSEREDDRYAPVVLIKTWKFDEIPDTAEEFCKILNPGEEE